MKITIYELLGLVKDGKAPNKIKYREMIYHINYEYCDYESDIEEYRFADVKGHYYLFEDIDMFKCLDDKIEILEEEKKDNFTGWKLYRDGKEVCLMDCSAEEEKKIPEKLSEDNAIWEEQARDIDYYFKNTINDIIDYLKSKGE